MTTIHMLGVELMSISCIIEAMKVKTFPGHKNFLVFFIEIFTYFNSSEVILEVTKM